MLVDSHRSQVYGFGRSTSQKAVWTEKKAVANKSKSGIIKVKKEPLSIYLNSSDELKRNALKVTPLTGYEDIVIHGDKTGFAIKDKSGKEHDYYTPREFAEILKKDPNYKGGNIRLMACEAGSKGAISAQILANSLNVEVLAPTDILWIDCDGNMTIGPDEFTNTGYWKKFYPLKSKR